jgi:hypothetical protein
MNKYIQEAYFNQWCRPYTRRANRFGCRRVYRTLCSGAKRSPVCDTKDVEKTRRVSMCSYLPKRLKYWCKPNATKQSPIRAVVRAVITPSRVVHLNKASPLKKASPMKKASPLKKASPMKKASPLKKASPQTLKKASPLMKPSPLKKAIVRHSPKRKVDPNQIGGFQYNENSCWLDSILFMLRYAHFQFEFTKTKNTSVCNDLYDILQLPPTNHMLESRLRDKLRAQLIHKVNGYYPFSRVDTNFTILIKCLLYNGKAIPFLDYANLVDTDPVTYLPLYDTTSGVLKVDIDNSTEFFFITGASQAVITLKSVRYDLAGIILNLGGAHFIVHYYNTHWYQYDDTAYRTPDAIHPRLTRPNPDNLIGVALSLYIRR